ncbi:Boron transporter 4, partial [Stylosanthes scabra]|nr:Boron transporter 4 [Stylosanthes scabra]
MGLSGKEERICNQNGGITYGIYSLPKFFIPHHLRELDAAEYEEIAGDSRLSFNMSFKEGQSPIFGWREKGNAEILDELTTSRGEVKVEII